MAYFDIADTINTAVKILFSMVTLSCNSHLIAFYCFFSQSFVYISACQRLIEACYPLFFTITWIHDLLMQCFFPLKQWMFVDSNDFLQTFSFMWPFKIADYCFDLALTKLICFWKNSSFNKFSLFDFYSLWFFSLFLILFSSILFGFSFKISKEIITWNADIFTISLLIWHYNLYVYACLC